MLVAFAIALGGLKSPRIIEITHSHAYGAQLIHSNILELLTAGKPGHQGKGDRETHTHRIPVSLEVTATAMRQGEDALLKPASEILPAEWRTASAPSRPADLPERPPKTLC